jgi:AcrR family transcriptional regulator
VASTKAGTGRRRRPARRRRLTREQSRAQTRQHLLDAAERVFLRRGFQAASVEQISAEAGYTRGAFYSNFDSKEKLFVELLNQRVFDYYRRMLGRVPKDASPIEQLRWSAREVRGRQEREADRWLFDLWLECLSQAARDPEFASLAASFHSATRGGMAAMIEQTFGDLGRPPPADPLHLASAMIALDIGLAIQHIADPDNVPLSVYEPLYMLLFGPLVAPDDPAEALS